MALVGEISGEREADRLRADAPAPGSDHGKTIILFSDGTGNSSSALFKTNVFRLYQALDLGPDADGRTTQIAYYDNGVGTSAVRLFAMLGGIFGWGLKRNMLHLYRFLCRNYNPGDRIYAFGFSRGAFTIRLLVGLICAQGIVPYRDERELHYNSADAFYRFVDGNKPDRWSWFWRIVSTARNGLRKAWRMGRRPFDVPGEHFPDVEFVGAWDTVAAYGGPISEITRGIDQYVWPLTMTDYILNPKVRRARHALAIDDERDSFWPLLWDEVSEWRNANDATRSAEQRHHFATRMKQVWFSGMHSDVGGGYPDDSLAYVSLVWMLDELGGALRFLPPEEERIRGFANAFGPMHDSRQGMGVYYRYQPRKIAAMLHRTVADTLDYDETLVLRDPTVGEKTHRPQGLLTACRVHASVIQRIGAGTDNYAPVTLPRDFEIVPAPVPAEATRQRDHFFLGEAAANLRKPGVAQARAEAQENAWDDVWHRRVGYFVVVALTVLLVAAPLYVERLAVRPVQDARWVLDIVIAWFGALVPGFAAPWFAAFQRLYLWFLPVGIVIAIVSARMTRQQQRLSDRLRIAWWDALRGRVTPTRPPTRLRGLRTNPRYQRGLQTLKWKILPAVVGIGIMPVLPIYLVTIVWAQWRAVGLERNAFCARPVAGTTGAPGGQRVVLDASDPCLPTGLRVTEGHRYRLVFHQRRAGKAWTDGRHDVPIGGQRSLSFPWSAKLPMLVASPFRRVVPAAWLEPLVEVRSLPVADADGDKPRIDIQRLQVLSPPRSVTAPPFAGEFVAARDGMLFLFLNDAVGPWGRYDLFYRNNRVTRNGGTADVCIEEAGQVAGQLAGGGASPCGIAGWTSAES